MKEDEYREKITRESPMRPPADSISIRVGPYGVRAQGLRALITVLILGAIAGFVAIGWMWHETIHPVMIEGAKR
jgi:hypothetical protein